MCVCVCGGGYCVNVLFNLKTSRNAIFEEIIIGHYMVRTLCIYNIIVSFSSIYNPRLNLSLSVRNLPIGVTQTRSRHVIKYSTYG